VPRAHPLSSLSRLPNPQLFRLRFSCEEDARAICAQEESLALLERAVAATRAPPASVEAAPLPSRRARDLEAAERRRLEGELVAARQARGAQESALKAARERTAELEQQASAAARAAKAAASELPALREALSGAGAACERAAQALESARTARAALSAAAAAAERRAAAARGGCREADAAKERALRDCLRCEAQLNEAKAALPTAQTALADARASACQTDRAVRLARGDASALRLRVDAALAEAREGEGAVAAGALAVGAAAAELAACRDAAKEAAEQLDGVQRCWSEARRGLDRAREHAAAATSAACAAQNAAEVQRREAAALRRALAEQRERTRGLQALSSQVTAQRDDYGAAALAARSAADRARAAASERARELALLDVEGQEKRAGLVAARAECAHLDALLRRTRGAALEARRGAREALGRLDSAMAEARAVATCCAALEGRCCAATAAFSALCASRTAAAAQLVAAMQRLAALRERDALTLAADGASVARCAVAEASALRLRRQCAAAERSRDAARARAQAVPLLEQAVGGLRAQLFQERQAADAEAQAQLACPAVRRLDGPGGPPAAAEALEQRDAALRAALATKERELSDATQGAAAALAACDAARAALAANADAPRASAQLNEARARLYRLQRATQALTAEISLYARALRRHSAAPKDVQEDPDEQPRDSGEGSDDDEEVDEEAGAEAAEAAVQAFVAGLPGVAEAAALEQDDEGEQQSG